MIENNRAIKARQWMVDHPEAMHLFRSLALQVVAKGRRTGIGALTERVRWEFTFERNGQESFKISNNHRAYLARELIATVPGFGDYINTHRVEGEPLHG